MTPDDLDTLREGCDFEAKLAAGREGRGALPDSVWETYSAMANTKGGLIFVFGVDPWACPRCGGRMTLRAERVLPPATARVRKGLAAASGVPP